MCVCACVCTCMHIILYTHTISHMYTCIYVYMYIYTYSTFIYNSCIYTHAYKSACKQKSSVHTQYKLYETYTYLLNQNLCTSKPAYIHNTNSTKHTRMFSTRISKSVPQNHIHTHTRTHPYFLKHIRVFSQHKSLCFYNKTIYIHAQVHTSRNLLKKPVYMHANIYIYMLHICI